MRTEKKARRPGSSAKAGTSPETPTDARVATSRSVLFHWPSLDSLVGGHDNNLNLIRFAAASAVIFSHSFALTGFTQEERFTKLVGISDLASVGVIVFFVISGPLVSQSAERSASAWRYLKARVLRIFPGLALATVFTVFIIGPLATTRSLTEYFPSGETLRYLYKNLVLEVGYFLPGVFENNPSTQRRKRLALDRACRGVPVYRCPRGLVGRNL